VYFLPQLSSHIGCSQADAEPDGAHGALSPRLAHHERERQATGYDGGDSDGDADTTEAKVRSRVGVSRNSERQPTHLRAWKAARRWAIERKPSSSSKIGS
jgi:hypothetical protein